MPEIVHFAGASHIDLTSVSTPGVILNQNVENLNPPKTLGQSSVTGSSLQIANADLTVSGTLTAGQSTINGGFSTNTFIFTNSLQVSKVLGILPTIDPALYWTSAVSKDYIFVTTQATPESGPTLSQLDINTGTLLYQTGLHVPLATPVIGVGSNVYVGDLQGNSSYIFIYSTFKLEFVGTLTSYSFQNVTGIVTDPTGAIYIAESTTGRIVKYLSESDTDPYPLEVGFSATSLAIDSLLNLYSTDGNYNIYKLNQAGLVVASFSAVSIATYGLNYNSLGVDSFFNVYVCDPNLNKIHVFFPNGSFGYEIPADNTFDLACISMNSNNDLYILHYYGRIFKNKIISETSDLVYTNSDIIRSADITSTNVITANTITFSNSFILETNVGAKSLGELATGLTELSSTSFLTPDNSKLILGQARVVDEYAYCAVNVYSTSDFTSPIASLDSAILGSNGFGWSVCANADGSTIAVGSPIEQAVYIYIAKVGGYSRAFVLNGGLGFGWCVSMDFSGTKLLVGCSDGGSGFSRDSASFSYYTFNGEEWLAQDVNNPTSNQSVDSVAVSGGGYTFVLGVSIDSEYSGAVYISSNECSTWRVINGTNPYDFFGYSVSTKYNGDWTIAVGQFYMLAIYIDSDTTPISFPFPEGHIASSCAISANNNSVVYGLNTQKPSGSGFIYLIKDFIEDPVTFSVTVPTKGLVGFGMSLDATGTRFTSATRSRTSGDTYVAPVTPWLGGINTGLGPVTLYISSTVPVTTYSYVSNTQSITYSGSSISTGAFSLQTNQASLDSVYTLQVSDSKLTTSGPYAMSVLNRKEYSALQASTSKYFHTEFVNTPDPLYGNSYGIAFGFLGDGLNPGKEPFIMAPHGSGPRVLHGGYGFDDTNNDNYGDNQPVAISIATGDHIGCVGIYGQNFPEKPLDVNGSAIIRGDLTVTGSMPSAVVTGRSTSYTIQDADYYVGVNGVGVVITLPFNVLVLGKQVVIKDESGLAKVNNITIITVDGSTIDGSSSVIISQNFASLTFLWTGASLWSII